MTEAKIIENMEQYERMLKDAEECIKDYEAAIRVLQVKLRSAEKIKQKSEEELGRIYYIINLKKQPVKNDAKTA